ncbi:hypothetical protein EON66_01905 [archaeon]|nr:MAG: hypothetical protein EON66_01905 [archaeon]
MAVQVVDGRCNSISWSDGGEVAAASFNNGEIALISGDTGKRVADFRCADTSTRLLTHTHHPMAVLHTAGRGAGDVSGQVVLHSLHDNRILRVFRGHSAPVTKIAFSPIDDSFVTVSNDSTFMMWDVRDPNAIARGEAARGRGGNMIAFRGDGLVYAVANSSRSTCCTPPCAACAFVQHSKHCCVVHTFCSFIPRASLAVICSARLVRCAQPHTVCRDAHPPRRLHGTT